MHLLSDNNELLPLGFFDIRFHPSHCFHLQFLKPFPNHMVHKTILIAEDMDDNYLLYKIYLEKKYNLIRAENGEEAISKFLEYSPAVILMDIGMPVVDGYQATEAIRQLSSKVPIVAVTAFAYDEDKRKVMSRGFNGYLSKPLNKEALFDMLRQMGI